MQLQEELARYGYRQELARKLRFRDLIAYGLVYMVPIAPMAIFGSVYAGSGGMVALAYAIGVVALVFTAFSYAQMVKAFPMSGSVYNYAGRGISPPVGFLTGWVILLDYVLVPGLLYLVASVAMHDASNAQAWITAHPSLASTLLDQDQAITLGRNIFEPLLA